MAVSVDAAHAARPGTSEPRLSIGPTIEPRVSIPIPPKGVFRGPGLEVTCATRRDYPRIHKLLRNLLREPSRAEFVALNHAPRYDISDRLIVRHGREIVAHMHLVPRSMHFGQLELPIMEVKHLALHARYRTQEVAHLMWDTARDEMRRAATVCATADSCQPEWFRQFGWFSCGHFSRSTIDVRSFLATAPVTPPRRFTFPGRSPRKRAVRIWRRYEIHPLTAIYERQSQNQYGAITRRESDWRWLLCRNSYDHIYVACESDPRSTLALDSPCDDSTILGYAVIRGNQILELGAPSGDSEIRLLLLERVCRDALESGRSEVTLFAPPDDWSHQEIFRRGGFHYVANQDGPHTCLAWIRDLEQLLNLLRPLLRDRLPAHTVPPGLVMNLDCGTEKLSVKVNSRSLSIHKFQPSPHVLRATPETLGSVILGHRSGSEALELGHLAASTPEAARLARALFPAVPLWRPAFDDLPSLD